MSGDNRRAPTGPIFSALAPLACDDVGCRLVGRAWVVLARLSPEIPQALADTTTELRDVLHYVAIITNCAGVPILGFPTQADPCDLVGADFLAQAPLQRAQARALQRAQARELQRPVRRGFIASGGGGGGGHPAVARGLSE